VFTWLQLGVHLKPVGLLNCAGFYDPLVQLLTHMCEQKFLTPQHFAMLTVADSVEPLIDALTTTRHQHLPKTVEYSSTDGNSPRRTVRV
jgi:predicted Rossmann-fold nucleotide-binding protein